MKIFSINLLFIAGAIQHCSAYSLGAHVKYGVRDTLRA